MSTGLLSAFYHVLARPVLFAMDAEAAHNATLAALRLAPLPPAPTPDPRLAVQAFGLTFPNPLGMAAGFDKGAEVPDALLRLGFGFTEIGTVTPKAQPGNSKPRLFRLVEDQAVINRFGFNSEGHTPVLARLKARARSGIVGVNIGANKEATDRVADYVAGIAVFGAVADYFTVNVSSPNTPGLRDLQQARVLDDLLARVLAARDATAPRVPVLLKIAPDLTLGDLDDIVRVARTRGVDGMIVSNTTIARPASLKSAQKGEAGGLSGGPLRAPSTAMLAATYLRVEGQFPLVGVGGIDGAEAALEKIKAGATLLQVYSAMVFQGPALVGRILSGLSDHLTATSGQTLASLVGTRAADLAAR